MFKTFNHLEFTSSSYWLNKTTKKNDIFFGENETPLKKDGLEKKQSENEITVHSCPIFSWVFFGVCFWKTQ